MPKLPIPGIRDRVAYPFGRSTTAATNPGLQGSAVSGSTGGTTANATTYREVLCVAGHAAARVRLLTVTSTGTLTVTPCRPEVATAGVPDEAVVGKDGSFDPTKIVKYTTGAASKAVVAATECVVDIALSGENYVLVEFACVGVGSITYCDACSIDYQQVPSTQTTTAASLAGFSATGATAISLPGDWSQGHAPVAATQATTTKAAGAAGVRHVCTSLSAVVATVGTLQGPLALNLRDGATGAGTILWTQTIQLPVNGLFTLALSGLNIVGSAATAMTLEVAGAPVAAATASVSLTGHDAT